MPNCGLRETRSPFCLVKVVHTWNLRSVHYLLLIQVGLAWALVGITGCNAPERSTDPPQVASVSEVRTETPEQLESEHEQVTSEEEDHLTPMGPADFFVNFPNEFGPIFSESHAERESIYDVKCGGGQSFILLTGIDGKDPPKSWTIGDADVCVHKSVPPLKGLLECSAIWPKERKIVRLMRIPDDAAQIVLQDLDGANDQILDQLVPQPVPSMISVASQSSVLMVTGLSTYRVWRLGQEPPYCEFENVGGSILAAIHPEGRQFVSGGYLPKIRSTRSGRVLIDYPKESGTEVTALAFSPTGNYLGIAGRVEVYPEGIRNMINAGRYAKSREQIQVWDYANGQVILDLFGRVGGSGRMGGHEQRVCSVAISNSERILIWVNSENILSACAIRRRAKPVHKTLNFKVHGGIAISDDDQFVVLGSENGVKAFRLDRLISTQE